MPDSGRASVAGPEVHCHNGHSRARGNPDAVSCLDPRLRGTSSFPRKRESRSVREVGALLTRHASRPMDTSSESTLPAAERPMPRYIRRSLLPLAVDDPALDGKAFGSWADAIVLDLARPPGVDWQAHARARMPAAIAAAARGGAEVFVRVDASAAVA